MGASTMGTFRLASGKKYAEAPLPFRAMGLSRFRLDQALLQAATDAGAEIERGITVSQIEPQDGRITINAGKRAFIGKAVALATGKHNLRQFPRAPSEIVGFKLQLRLASSALHQLKDIVQLAMFDGGYFGACIVEDEIVTVGWVLDRALLQRIGTDWQAQLSHFSRQSEILGDLLQSAQPEWGKSVAVAAIPYGYLRRQVIAPGIFPLGDQLAVIPSFTGDGMAIALYSGIAAAQAILAGDDAAHYQQRMLARLRRQFRWAATTNLLFEKKKLHGFSVALATAMPWLVTRIAQSTRLRGFEDVTGSHGAGFRPSPTE